jgi:L-alanine-DL-glutamate epimerase-like enolase superfamily enzyme
MRLRSATSTLREGPSPSARAGAVAVGSRRGLLLTLTDLDGTISQGEASPLPGYSVESLATVERALSLVDWASVPEIDAGEPARAYLTRIRQTLLPLPASARFAVETALLDLVGKRRGAPRGGGRGECTTAPRPPPHTPSAP